MSVVRLLLTQFAMLRWLAAARPEAYALYTDALSRLDAAALERWVAYLEALLDGPQ